MFIHISPTIKEARENYNKACMQPCQKCKWLGSKGYIKTLRGHDIYYISEWQYGQFCKGYTYMILGDKTRTLYHSGYPVKGGKK